MSKTRWLVSLSFAAALAPAVFGGTSMAGELDDKMSNIVNSFSRAAFEAGVSTATLAVLPFRTNRKQTEEIVSHMCVKILTSRFVETKTFRVVERDRLEEVMREQRFGLSGAVGDATAAKVGRLSGARFLILGSVTRLVNSYQLGVKMVDSGTGAILAAEVAEVSSEIFGKNAPQSPVRTPEARSMELYLAGIYSPITTSAAAPANYNVAIAPTNPSGNLLALGAGVRYFFRSRWMLDLTVLPHMTIESDKGAFSLNGEGVKDSTQWRGYSIQLTANRGIMVSREIRGFAGAGVMMMKLNNYSSLNTSHTVGRTTIKVDDVQTSYIIPAARLGIEWKLKNLFGLTVFGNYNIYQPNIIKETATISTDCGGNIVDRKQMVVRKFKLPRFYISASMTFFFHTF